MSFPAGNPQHAKQSMTSKLYRLTRITFISGCLMPLDIEKYRHFAARYDLSEEEQTELIQQLWGMLESFVDQAFGRHPHQQCGRRIEFNDLQASVESLESKAHNPLEKTDPINTETLKHTDPP